MAVGDAQYREGYTLGFRGAVIEVLQADGSAVTPTPTTFGIKTPQELGYEFGVIEGNETQLRGGDIVLTNVKETDIITSASLSMTNAKFDLECTYHIAGGTLVTEEIDLVDYNTGWEFPTLSEQYSKVPFKFSGYVANYDSAGKVNSYFVAHFWYCMGYLNGVTHADQEWGTPEFTIYAEENGAQSKPIVTYDWEDTLPTELTA